MADELKWYVAHTYSGYENTVAASIEKSVENRNMKDLITEVNIPMETVTEITDNGPKTVERKVFPGYVLVKMVMTDETWHLVRNIRGVTGFVGSANKGHPPHRRRDRRSGRGKARGSGVLRRGGQCPRSPTAPWSPLSAPWRAGSGPGQGPRGRVHVRAGRLPSSWSWTRWSQSNPKREAVVSRRLRWYAARSADVPA